MIGRVFLYKDRSKENFYTVISEIFDLPVGWNQKIPAVFVLRQDGRVQHLQVDCVGDEFDTEM